MPSVSDGFADRLRRAMESASITQSKLAALVGATQPAVSQHLAALKNAGLVRARREGRSVYYRIAPRGLKPLLSWIAHYRAFWTERVDRLERLLEKMDE